MPDVACSIVLYKTDRSIIKLVNDILDCKLAIRVYLIDNSPTDILKQEFNHPNIKYIFNNSNLGYGVAHNIALEASSKEKIKYHLVMNPDISFENGTLESIHSYMEKNEEVGLLMPKVYFRNGDLQRLCKLLPSPFDLLGRRFFSKTSFARKLNTRYELADFNYDVILNTPCLSGCFMFIRTSVLHKAGFFDPRYFMYLEDYDLVRRIHRYAKTIFFPEVSIIHGFKKESFVSNHLFRIHIQSAVKYFNKWGWIWDRERTKFNAAVLKQIRNDNMTV